MGFWYLLTIITGGAGKLAVRRFTSLVKFSQHVRACQRLKRFQYFLLKVSLTGSLQLPNNLDNKFKLCQCFQSMSQHVPTRSLHLCPSLWTLLSVKATSFEFISRNSWSRQLLQYFRSQLIIKLNISTIWSYICPLQIVSKSPPNNYKISLKSLSPAPLDILENSAASNMAGLVRGLGSSRLTVSHWWLFLLLGHMIILSNTMTLGTLRFLIV